MKNAYGYDTCSEVPLPEGEEMLGVWPPNPGDRYLDPYGHLAQVHEGETAESERIILKPRYDGLFYQE